MHIKKLMRPMCIEGVLKLSYNSSKAWVSKQLFLRKNFRSLFTYPVKNGACLTTILTETVAHLKQNADILAFPHLIFHCMNYYSIK